MNDAASRARRREAVRDLVELRVPVERAVAELTSFGWDSNEELHILTRSDARRLLQRYRRGELTAGECRLWAETLEGRDDLGLEQGAVDTLTDFLFELATPELTESLTRETAGRWELLLAS